MSEENKNNTEEVVDNNEEAAEKVVSAWEKANEAIKNTSMAIARCIIMVIKGGIVSMVMILCVIDASRLICLGVRRWRGHS